MCDIHVMQILDLLKQQQMGGNLPFALHLLCVSVRVCVRACVRAYIPNTLCIQDTARHAQTIQNK